MKKGWIPMNKHLGRAGVAIVTTAAMTLCSVMPAFAAASGDVNRDSSFNLADAVAFSQFLTGQSNALADSSAADYDGNGKLNAVDLTLMKRALIIGTGTTNPDPNTDDTYVTQITYASGSVTLKNASDQVVSASNASNVTVSNGTYVTITKPTTDGTTDFGDINVDGECANGQIKVDVDENTYATGQVTINLRGLTLSNSSDSPIYVNQIADECVITVKNGTTNTISDGTNYTNADGSEGAIYSLDDLKFKGKGTLIVKGNCGDGIVSKDDLKIWNGDIQVTAVDDGIRGKDSIRIGDPDDTDYSSLNITIKSTGGDGLKTTNDTADSGKGYIRINGGTVNITADNGDGIQAQQSVEINGGDITIYTYQGSGYTGSGSSSGSTGSTGGWGGGQGGMQDGTDISAKGIKSVGIYDTEGTTWQSAGNITVAGGTLNINTSDDALHCGGDMTITGGVFTVQTADDAFHSDHTLTIGTQNAGKFDDVRIYVSKCYEGIEGVTINQNSGTVYIVSTDDGYNAAGGADGSGTGNTNPWGGGGMSTSSGTLNLNGGLVVVNTNGGDNDAFDSNGNLTITGGYYCANGNETMDYDGSYSNNGGSIISISRGGNTNLTTRYSFCDNSGNVIVSFVSASGGSATVSNCTAYSGGTVSGGTELLSQSPYQIYTGGTLSGGSAVSGSR